MIKKSCHVMVKPVGAACNLNCDYCFYLEKAQIYPGRQQKCMDDATLELFVEQHIKAQQTDEVIFAWQGGEPTLAGLDFYQRAVALQEKYSCGKRIINTLQTNGLLLNDAWCRFLSKHHFLIGLSIDGDAELHDAWRKTRSGKPTHDRVENAVRLLIKHHIEFNTLTVVNNINVHHPLRVYDYLRSIGSRDMQFIPLLERHALAGENRVLVSPDDQGDAAIAPWSVPGDAFGVFLKTIFYTWIRRDIGDISIQLFEQAFAAWCGLPAQICVFAERCGSALAMEMNGDVYQCDHYVWPRYKLGNIHSTPLAALRDGDANQAFSRAKAHAMAAECHRCPYRFACYGGCPKHRILPSAEGKLNRNWFCEGYQAFFSYINPYMLMLKTLSQSGRSPAEIKWLIA
ncbi:anaerobic sulfatase maturase [Cronobacter muytjensii]|nr:anaerobic sulfatase maturase [Cronobacter muytjensii]EKS1843692.1 anaerobic sulfatase maturase [Cronobacter muytjensii]ELY6273410.1 anaerobic sulfatase maturase [Cronobacter muytjensii]MEB8639536.1 anaerobic sulfatase maturase [Cronobacter muytjensii]